jgi:hypothetical protein
MYLITNAYATKFVESNSSATKIAEPADGPDHRTQRRGESAMAKKPPGSEGTR